MTYRDVPTETMDRLFLYMRALTCLRREKSETVSSSRLAEICNVNAPKVRKDLSYFGEFGVRGVGYNVNELLDHIRRILKLDRSVNVALIGAGNIGRALITHSSFQLEGFNISMAFDIDREKIGTRVGSITVEDMMDFPDRVEEEGIDLAILAVPEEVAPEIARIIADTNIISILSFAPCELCMPENVKVTCVDLSMEMARLLYNSRQTVTRKKKERKP
ncbi:MAG: hypothetical protein AVO35_11160 [Candidatus Aegiribacteria sp. MLS_C]|nr:MAG: hypothetical protein AVO35_11160 [Candidatus Aegiribacteria sp. MLS_C]